MSHPASVFRKGRFKCRVVSGSVRSVAGGLPLSESPRSPKACLCIDHAWRIEDFGGEFKVQFYQERTSKAGSLKVNYGGIATRLVRNQAALQRLIERYEEEEFGNGVQAQPG